MFQRHKKNLLFVQRRRHLQATAMATIVALALLAYYGMHSQQTTATTEIEENQDPFLQAIDKELAAFEADPKSYLNQIPEKSYHYPQTVQDPATPNPPKLEQSLSLSEALDNPTYLRFLEDKLKQRKQMNVVVTKDDEDKTSVALPRASYDDILNQQSKADIYANDRAESLMENYELPLTHLNKMESYRQARLEQDIWSDTYWPYYRGLIGNRYHSEEYIQIEPWEDLFSFVTEKSPAEGILRHESYESYDKIAVAEKYDALIGLLGSKYSMTTFQWDQVQRNRDADGTIPTWIGLCHGWAPAAYQMPRPPRSLVIEVPISSGEQVAFSEEQDVRALTFYPADIKALQTYIWSYAAPSVRFMGGRCNVKDPKTDETTGRIENQDCFDNNPGSWHMAVVNQVGYHKRSLVIDATFDYEVWNHPVKSYRYIYFNPLTQQRANKLEEALVTKEQMEQLNAEGQPNDLFHKFRSESGNYSHIVGVAMEVEYVVETEPHAVDWEPAGYNTTTARATYLYDLNLLAETIDTETNYQIVGGEWYRNAHPDFVWSPVREDKALSPHEQNPRLAQAVEKALAKWKYDPSQAIVPYFPEEIRGNLTKIAQAAATWQVDGRRGVSYPLAGIIDKLVSFSQQRQKYLSQAR